MTTLYRKLRRIKNNTRYNIGKIIGPIWYRFFGYKHHIIKTSLAPAVWYDTDIRMLYAVMDTVKWFVDNDMDHQWTEESVKEEIEQIKNEYPKECQEQCMASIQNSYEADKTAISIVKWWENYPNREKEIDDEEIFEKAYALEKQLEEEEQEMLIKAIKYRRTMWS